MCMGVKSEVVQYQRSERSHLDFTEFRTQGLSIPCPNPQKRKIDRHRDAVTRTLRYVTQIRRRLGVFQGGHEEVENSGR